MFLGLNFLDPIPIGVASSAVLLIALIVAVLHRNRKKENKQSLQFNNAYNLQSRSSRIPVPYSRASLPVAAFSNPLIYQPNYSRSHGAFISQTWR